MTTPAIAAPRPAWAGDVRIDQVIADPRQPRKHYDEAALEQLTASIKSLGIIEPLVVRQVDPKMPGSATAKWILVAGERRLRAARRAGLATVPVVVRSWDPQQAHVAQLAENMEREDLRPLEIAESYHRWLQPTGNDVTTVTAGKLDQKPQYKRSQAELAKALGKTEAHVSQVLALRQLPAPARKLIDDGVLSFAHGRALVPLMPYPPALNRVVTDVEERTRWGYVWTTRELTDRVNRHLTRVKAAAARKKKGKKRGGAAPIWRVQEKLRQAAWEVERKERQALEAARATVIRTSVPKWRKAAAADRLAQMVKQIPAALLGYLARGLNLPTWGAEGHVVKAIRPGSSARDRVAFFVWFKRSWPTVETEIAREAKLLRADQKAQGQDTAPARKGGRK